MQSITDALFGSLLGLAAVAAASVGLACLLAAPFVIIARLGRIQRALDTLIGCVRDEERERRLDTMNKNLGFLVLNLPKMLGTGSKKPDG